MQNYVGPNRNIGPRNLIFIIFWSFGIYFLPFWYVVPIKIWQPCRLLKTPSFAAREKMAANKKNCRKKMKMAAKNKKMAAKVVYLF
jgi:hypothetical protein